MYVSPSSSVGSPVVSPSIFERIQETAAWAANKTLLKLQEVVTLVWNKASQLMTSRHGPIAFFSTLTAGGVFIFYTKHANVSAFRRKVLGIFVLLAAFATGVATGRAMYLIKA